MTETNGRNLRADGSKAGDEHAAREPVDYVEPRIDSANRRYFFFSSACRPFGMVNLSPDTVAAGAWEAGYRYREPHICWFSHLHAWQLAGIPLLPITGEMIGHRGVDRYKSAFSHDTEVVHPGYHRVDLDTYSITAELTATTRVGFHRYTFRDGGRAHILCDLGASIGPVDISDVSVTAVGANRLTGYVENERTRRRPKNTRIYFVLETDRAWSEFGGWRSGRVLQADRNAESDAASASTQGALDSLSGQDTGCYLSYDVSAGDIVQVKVAISYCSVDRAIANLESELSHWDFSSVVQDARDEWNRRLGAIRVAGGSERKKIKLYTDLYHSLLGRRRVSDSDGSYCDMTGPEPTIRSIAKDEDGRPKYEHHNSDAFWGGQWTLGVLWPLVCPDIVHNFCNMFVDYYHNGGLIPRGPSGGNYTFVMISATTTPFVVSAYQKGIADFDVTSAYRGLVKNHGPGGLMARAGYEHETATGGGVEHYISLGYVPEGVEADAVHIDSAGMTLEYAFCDWCLAQFSRALGHNEDFETYAKRAQNYRNLWDGASGYFRPRNTDGSWYEPFDPWEPHGWCEANGFQYLWWVPHDIRGLAELTGGAAQAVERLDDQFEGARAKSFIAPHGRHHENYMDYGNQPSTHLAHLFAWFGRPDLTQKWVREVYDAAKSAIDPDGGYGGDEDQGMMGSLNVLFAVGLFQLRAGCDSDPLYELTTPLFQEVRISLDSRWYNASELVIQTDKDPATHPYIAAATLNDRPLEAPCIRHSDIRNGARLHLTLSAEASSAWGRDTSWTRDR